MKIIFITLFVLTSFVFSSNEITVSILPQKYILKKITQNKFTINVMLKQGFSPENYEPKSSQMKLLSKSKIYFSIGVPFEFVWLAKFKSNAPKTLFIDTSKGIKKLSMEGHHHEENHNEENHNDEEHHKDMEDNDTQDPHIWLDPLLVKIQAKTMYEALKKIDKKNEAFYTKNYLAFIKELDLLNTNLINIFTKHSNLAFVVFHPSWGYFAKRYNLEQIEIQNEGKEIKANELIQLIKKIRKKEIKKIFVSPQFSQEKAKIIARSINTKLVLMDPLAFNIKKNLIKLANEIVRIPLVNQKY